MIYLGADAVEVERFNSWISYPQSMLLRVFSDGEIKYCRAMGQQAAQCFSVRFAAKEALYKAVSQAYGESRPSFLSLCAYTQVIKVQGIPYLKVDPKLGLTIKENSITLSLTHTKHIAFACVLLCHIP
jgi:phosphopantetheine--protein transferase-like protein